MDVRLIVHLLRLAEECGKRDGTFVEFELKENNEELAARLGTVRELISCNLGTLAWRWPHRNATPHR